MPRVDLFTPVHKGLRAALCDTLGRVGSTGFGDPAQVRLAVRSVRTLLGLLDEHGLLEERFLVPVLSRLDAALGAELSAGHRRLETLQHTLALRLVEVEDAAGEARAEAGRRLGQDLCELGAESLRHMLTEEREANALLHAHLEDADLRALERGMLQALPPRRLAGWMGWILPALGAGERASALAALREALPGEALADVTEAARQALGSARWQATRLAAGL